MKAQFKAENGIVSVDGDKELVSITLGETEMKLTKYEAKELLKILKIVT